MKSFAKLLQTGKTIFTVQTLQKVLDLSDDFSIRNALHRFSKQGFLINLYYGVWGLVNYDKFELSNTLKKPSYISLETVLYKQGIVFQNYSDSILLISTRKDEKVVENTKYQYFRIKNEILLNPMGLIQNKNYVIASPERAICDRLYLTPDYYFDNLRNISWQKLEEIAHIYDNKRLVLDIQKLKENVRY